VLDSEDVTNPKIGAAHTECLTEPLPHDGVVVGLVKLDVAPW
jgi:hypothetical protein